MDTRRSRFSPEPPFRDLNAFRTRAVSQPPRSQTAVDAAISFTLPETFSTIHRTAQSPTRDRPFPPQRLGRSPVVSRVPAPRSASFSTGHVLDHESWRNGPNLHSTFDEDDEEALDSWDHSTAAEPRSWSNIESRFRSNVVGPRSRSLAAPFTNPSIGTRDFLGPSSLSAADWGDATTSNISNSVDNRYLHDYNRVKALQSQSLQSTASMPGRLSHEVSNISPFGRERIEEFSYHDPWAPLASMREEEGTGSGATSRRHSVSVVQGRPRGVVGFTASNGHHLHDDEPAYTHGRSTFSDEELAGDFSVLNVHSSTLHEDPYLAPFGVRVAAQSPPRSRLSAFQANIESQRPYDIGSKRRSPSNGRSPALDSYPSRPMEQRGNAPVLHLPRNSSPSRRPHSRDSSPNPPASNNTATNLDSQATNATDKSILLEDLRPNTPLAIVEFKVGRKELFYYSEKLKSTQIGDRLVVEGDRGKDLGIVIQANIDRNWLINQRRGAEAGIPMNPHQRAKPAYRVANSDDLEKLVLNQSDERKALAFCQSKVRQKNLPMQVVDCEFQWDRMKLTFFFTADTRIDFRDLVRELFRLYKTRIWMSCVSGPLATNVTTGSSTF